MNRRNERNLNRIRKLEELRNITDTFLTTNIQRLRVNLITNEFSAIETFNIIQPYLFNYIVTGDNSLLIECNDVWITLNQSTIEDFINKYRYMSIEQLDELESDEGVIYQLKIINTFTLHKVDDDNVNRRQGGAFFPYINKTKINLTELGIFQEIKKENYKECCLIQSFLQTDISKEKIDLLRTIIFYDKVPKCKLQKVVDLLEINIKLYHYNYNNKKFKENKYFYKKNKKNNLKTYELVLFKEHYFINKKIDVTSYSIKNYEKVKDIKDFNKIYKKGKYYEKSNERQIEARQVVKLMLENNLFEPLKYSNDLFNTQFGDRDFELDKLDYDENLNCRLVKLKENKKEKKENYKISYFDFETYINEDNKHIPYLCCLIDEDNNKKVYYGKDCGKQLLKELKEDTLLIAHNSSYDLNFVISYFTKIKSLIKRSSKTISCKGKYKKINIEVRDSWSMISMPLKKFGKCFKLKQGKEVISYNSYNDYFNNNIYQDGLYPIDIILEEFKNDKEKQKTFLENIEKWNLKKGKYFDLITYSKEYCMIDCEVLKNGYEKFREWILHICNLDIKNILTIASLADKYFIKEGCFDNCYELNGIPRYFIQQSVVGGRCMSNDNKKYYIKDSNISDFDAVSLYPSAMYRLKGYLRGKPKVLKNHQLNYGFLQRQDGYFVEIKINKINKKRGFSLISKINKEGVRDFNNNYKNELFIVDKTTLEDWVQYHKIDFEVIKGYYFNEGFNTKIKNKIKYIFEERLRMKKQDNPVQLVYKLLMNSGYGKTIQKPIDSETKVFSSYEDCIKYIKINYNYIKEFYNISNSDLWIVKISKPINDHFSRSHIGSTILSMSKRIMNEVMTTAEDNGIMIYYQDTDSMHLHTEDIPKLRKLFNKKYNRELIGKNMGQFHSDFELDGAKKDIYSKNLIILGKKCYLDDLVGKNDKNEIIKGFHLRMKGVPNSTILYECKKLNISPLKMYEKLYKGEKISFDLLENGKRVQFKQTNNYSMYSCEDFTRSLQFK